MKEPFVILKPYGNVEWEREALSHLAEIRNPLCATEEDIIREVKGVDLLIADVDITISKKILDAADRLKAVVCASTGIDFMDVPAATKKGIVVTNLPDYCVEAVAEYALALIFSLSRHIVSGVSFVKEGKWQQRRDLEGTEIEGKTLGIIGLGRIGRRVAEKTQALAMEVAFYDPLVSAESVREKGYEKKETLNELLRCADFISVHASLISETQRMFGEEEFRQMKPSAYFVNVARGGIVDENALCKALKEGWLAGAAVDVLSREPLDKDHPLLGLENILITPHIAYNTRDAKEKARNQLKQIMINIIKHEFPINVVNPEVKATWMKS